MAREPLSDLEAIFSMPGLEEISAPLVEYSSPERAVAILGFLAGRAAVGSANKLSAMLSRPSTWAEMCLAAESVGRSLPAKPPTFDMLHHLREKIGRDEIEAVLLEMENRMTVESFKLARSVGMCDPATIGDALTPVRSNTLWADGTWWDPLSKVTVDPETGEVTGSRSKGVQGPRVAEVRTITKNNVQLKGVPFVMAGVRGDRPLERIVLGIRRFHSPGLSGDGGETPAADELLKRVIAASGGGIRWCVYDMAFRGANLNELAKQGVIGIAAMVAAAEDAEGLELVEGEEVPERFNNDGRKTRFATGSVKTVQHRVGERWCSHALSGVDGSLRMHDPARSVRMSDPLCPVRSVDSDAVDRYGNHKMLATFEVPCPHGSMFVPIEMTGHMSGRSGTLVLNRIRVIHEYDKTFETLKGWRQDVESLNATMKRVTPLDGQATSLHPAFFELDVLGSALRINAQCWDTYAGRVSQSSQDAERRRLNRILRQSAS